jgi:hypothetical protein
MNATTGPRRSVPSSSSFYSSTNCLHPFCLRCLRVVMYVVTIPLHYQLPGSRVFRTILRLAYSGEFLAFLSCSLCLPACLFFTSTHVDMPVACDSSSIFISLISCSLSSDIHTQRCLVNVSWRRILKQWTIFHPKRNFSFLWNPKLRHLVHSPESLANLAHLATLQIVNWKMPCLDLG